MRHKVHRKADCFQLCEASKQPIPGRVAYTALTLQPLPPLAASQTQQNVLPPTRAAVVEQSDVPAGAERAQELAQGARPLREVDLEDALVGQLSVGAACAAAHQVAQVYLFGAEATCVGE